MQALLTAHPVLPTAHCSLLNTYYSLLTALCSMLSPYYSLLSALCSLLTAYCLLLTALSLLFSVCGSYLLISAQCSLLECWPHAACCWLLLATCRYSLLPYTSTSQIDGWRPSLCSNAAAQADSTCSSTHTPPRLLKHNLGY